MGINVPDSALVRRKVVAFCILGDTGLQSTLDRKASQVVRRLGVPASHQSTGILQSHSGELLEFKARLCHTTYRAEVEEESSAKDASRLVPQHGPGGIGAPCGQVRG